MKRTITRLLALTLTILLATGLAGCLFDGGDYDNNGGSDDTGPPDTQQGDTTTDDAGEDTTEDTGEPDTGACGGECTDPTPVCDVATGQCVACTVDEGCGNDEVCAVASDPANNQCVACVTDDDCGDQYCDDAGDDDPSNNSCVDCREESHCTDAAAAHCGDDNTCVPCTEAGHCDGVDSAGICDTSDGDGVCIECTIEDDGACTDGECDPETNTCLERTIGSGSQCDSCASDSDCGEYMRCVPMQFQGSDLGESYCLKLSAAGCSQPYLSSITRDTVDGESGHEFCGLNESATTCPALGDFQNATDCTLSVATDQCGIDGVDDGLCRERGLGGPKCTYECGSATQCPNTFVCNTDDDPGYCDEP